MYLTYKAPLTHRSKALCYELLEGFKKNKIRRKKLKILDIRTLLQSRRLRWYGHVRRSSMCIKDMLKLPLSGGRSRGRPAKTWFICVEKDMESYGLENAAPLKREEWRKCISRLLYTPATGTPTAV